ncbi:MAG TPA: DUF2911 domain-containing protein [Puia sp.]|nr:DUF2911 domain-containing protein [Puia sp.]
MKKLLLFSVIALFGLSAFSQEKAVSPHETATGKNISVRYGRPYKKGRVIFGGLVPYDKVYRCGADSATLITFDKDAVFGGKKVKAGTYTLFVVPKEKSWTIILNGQLGQWGAYSYDKYKDKDVLHVEVPVMHTADVVEQLTIRIPDNAVVIEWDQTQVSVPVKI